MSFSKNKGNFTVEFAIVAIFFALLIAFSGDVIVKLSIKGKLDRMAYSSASIIKERKQLFGDEFSAVEQEGIDAYTIVNASLGRTISNFDTEKFGFSLDMYELISGTVSKTTIYNSNSSGVGIACTVPTPKQALFITTTYGRSLTLYQATLCYQTNNWFGSLVGETYDRVQSYAAVMGR